MNRRGRFLAVTVSGVLGCGAVAACGSDVQPVTVSVQALDRAGQRGPIAGAQLTLLPFDIDSVYVALEKKNEAGPPPDTAPLEILYQGFYRADSALVAADSLLASRQRGLEAITDRASPEYRQAFADFEAAQKQYDSLSVAKDSAQTAYSPAREAYTRARSTWESSSWDGFTQISENLYSAVQAPRDSAGQEIEFKHRTGEDGTFKIWLAPGTWWVAGRAGVPGSVRAVYRWNVPFTVGQEPVMVELTEKNAKELVTY